MDHSGYRPKGVTVEDNQRIKGHTPGMKEQRNVQKIKKTTFDL